MRLNLYWRGRDVIDIELHAWRKREDTPDDEAPRLQAAAHPVDTSRAEPMQPDCTTFGFGIRPETAA